MINKYFILAILLFALAGKAKGQYCTNDSRYTEVSYFDSTQITIGTNIQYGVALDFQGNPDTLLLDLYYPNLALDASPKRPFIIVFHGGGFSSGNKQSGDIRDLCFHLARRGFVCASANYRLGHDFSEYGQYKARYRAIQDGHAALRFIINNANTVRIDTSWLFVGGQSAGSLLALGMAYSDQFELDSISLLYNAISTSVELGNLKTSGNNLTNSYSIKGIFNNWGGIVESEVDIDEMIPTVAFHGELDTLVPIDSDNSFANYTLAGSRALHNLLTANNTCSELTVDTLGEHGIFRNASSVFRAQRASCFFKSIFCANCSNLYTTDSIPPNCSISSSMDEKNLASTIKVYPNPFENSIRVEGMEGTLDITLFNHLGQLVYMGIENKGTIQIDLIPGIYFLTIKQIESNQSFTTKLIKN
jgi:poly(3-hydroxybutyrate) depolymerase